MSSTEPERPGRGGSTGGGPAAGGASLWKQVWILASGVAWDPVEAYEKLARKEQEAPTPASAALLIGLIGVAFGLFIAVVTVTSGQGGFGLALSRFFLTALGLIGLVFVGAAAVIWSAARLLGSRVDYQTVLTGWAASYVPTAVWFAGNLAVHGLVLLLGLQTGLASGRAWLLGGGGWFVLLFGAFSLAMFLWKALLLYLTLRILGRLDFRRIVLASALLALVVLGYWALGLDLGLFKIPFI